MASPIVVFDLDGTLIDTAPDLVATLNGLFADRGIPPVAYQETRDMIGGGVKVLIERGLKHQGVAFTPAQLDALYSTYLERYAARIAELSRPFPGLIEALDTLSARGFALAVCTNKLEWLSVKLLEELGLAGRFAAICGQDTFGIAKPDPKMLHRTIARAGGDSSRAVMVGDSATDVNTALAARIPVIAVDFGYTEIPVHKLGADKVISHFDRLVAEIDALLG